MYWKSINKNTFNNNSHIMFLFKINNKDYDSGFTRDMFH